MANQLSFSWRNSTNVDINKTAQPNDIGGEIIFSSGETAVNKRAKYQNI